MKIGRLLKLTEPLDLDLQLVATELDTSAVDLFYFCSDEQKSVMDTEEFNNLLQKVQEGGSVFDLNGNTVMYEFLEQPIIIYQYLATTYIIFDRLFQRIYNSSKIGLGRDYLI